MATAYSDVFDSFLVRIKDWRLDTLYQSSPTDFETYLTGFLQSAVSMFYNCNQDLTRDDTAKTFTENLNELNKVILAELMVEVWLEKEVQDVRQMNLKITDKDFKTFSEAQNLTAKNNRWSEVRERNSQRLVDYGLQNIDWDAWRNGSFA